MSTDDQSTKCRRKIAEIYNPLSRVHERYRQTDGRQHIANVNMSSRSLKTPTWVPATLQPRSGAESLHRHMISLIYMAKRICDSTALLQKLSTIDDVTKYHDMPIPVSRYFLRRYIIVGHLLIPRIPSVYFCLTVCLSVCTTGNRLEEHDDDITFQTGNRHKTVSRMCIEKYAL